MSREILYFGRSRKMLKKVSKNKNRVILQVIRQNKILRSLENLSIIWVQWYRRAYYNRHEDNEKMPPSWKQLR